MGILSFSEMSEMEKAAKNYPREKKAIHSTYYRQIGIFFAYTALEVLDE